MPKQELTEVGERGTTLSGGQQQRLSIARALYRDADLIIADDPISALDLIVADEVFLSLKKTVTARGGRHSCLVVLNQLRLLPHFDHVIMLSAGRVVEQGCPLRLLQSEGPLRAFCLEAGCDVASMLSKDNSGVAVPKMQVEENSKDKQKSEEEEEESSARLVRAEEELEAAPLQVLVRYVRGMGYIWFGLCNLLVIAAYCSLAFVDYWLALWVDAREAYWMEGRQSDDDVYLTVYGAAAGVFVVLMCLTSYCFGEGGVRSSRRLHGECVDNLLHAPVHFFESTPSGRIMSRFSNDMAGVDKEMPKWFDYTWQLSATVLMLFVQVSLLVNLMLPVVLATGGVFILKVRVVYRTNRWLRGCANAAMGPVLTTVNECVNGRQVIRIMEAGEFFEHRLCSQLDAHHAFSYAALASVNCGGMLAYFICFLTAGSTSALVIANRDRYPPSFCALALTYSFLLPYFLNLLSMGVQMLLTSLTGLERLLQYGNGGILPAEPQWHLSTDKTLTEASWPEEGRIVFEDVSLVYRPGMPKAVDRICFHLSPGEKVGMVGRSGAGKSSLMVLLLRLNEACEGRILIDGVDIAHIGLRKLRRAIAVVPQEPLLIEGSVRQNLDPFDEHSDAVLTQVLERIERPDLLHTSSSSSLSQGERQLVTIGRTLLWSAKVRVFDEPTSNIDAATDRLIQRFLRSAMFGQSTQITVAHRLQTVLGCDRILVMSAGRLVESGPPQELLNHPGSHLSALAAHVGEELKQHTRLSL